MTGQLRVSRILGLRRTSWKSKSEQSPKENETMNIRDDRNLFEGPGQMSCFLDLIESGATLEDASEITGITPEELAECRAIDPKFDAGLESLAPDPWIDRLMELLAHENRN
jgi:hypothetical protein